MIPWLTVVERMSATGKSLSSLLGAMRQAHPSSGEVNFRVPDTEAVCCGVARALAGQATAMDRMDGLSLEFDRWRMNLRASSTEPLLRLNMESRGDAAVLHRQLARVTALIHALADRLAT